MTNINFEYKILIKRIIIKHGLGALGLHTACSINTHDGDKCVKAHSVPISEHLYIF